MYSNIIITSQLRLQLRAPCVPPPIFVFRCYDNIQPPVCTYLNINYSVYIIVNIYVRVVAPGTVYPGAHFCVYKICIFTNNDVPIKHLLQNPLPNIPRQFSILAAIHLFISSRNEIKISARWIKKLVAATDGVYVHIHQFIFTWLNLYRVKFLQYINPPIIVSSPERNGALHCSAHFCVYEICIITNNAVPIKFRTQNPNTIITPTPTVFCPEFSMRNA